MSAPDIKQDFINIFLSADNPFRESMSYTPSGSTAKTIYGIVNRAGASKTTQSPRSIDKIGSVYDYEIIISCDATNGIENVVAGKDKVVITAPEFAETNTFTVAGVIAKTPMCWKLGLRA